jgi:nucleoid-associated protein YgaU
MPISRISRYRGLPSYLAPGRDGAPRAVLPARLSTTTSNGTPLLHQVKAGETLESLAFHYLGSCTAWWQIADANEVLFPTALQPGATLLIPSGRTQGEIVRTRSF